MSVYKSPMKWGQLEIEVWYKQQKVKRSYRSEVISLIKKYDGDWKIHQYGALSLDPGRYPLFMLKSQAFDPRKKTVLITGGVHGYETSGVHGAIGFFEKVAASYIENFNFFCFPCISPWGYETINRWNHKALDPNRSFYENSPAEECNFFLKALSDFNINPIAHFDLHETTDTDNTLFRPALEQRDGVPQELWDIPDGFYLVGNSQKPAHEFQKSIIESVKKVTHIAPSDKTGKIIGVPIEQDGVINYDVQKLNLCASSTRALYTTTTEVYPDSAKVTPALCIQAQIAAIQGGLQYLLKIQG